MSLNSKNKLRFGGLTGSRPPSWIPLARIWTTHDNRMVVFSVVLNLVGIDAVVLIKLMHLLRV